VAAPWAPFLCNPSTKGAFATRCDGCSTRRSTQGLGGSPELPQALREETQRVVLRDGDLSRFGVVQAITQVAHHTNKDPDVRFAMERLAGDYLAATPTVAVA
jgi:hypothetical protein